MKLGEVYVWETQRAQGHDTRKKYHVFICPEDDEEGHMFLYINSVDWYKDYKLSKDSYNFLVYDSFVGCNAIVAYTTGQLNAVSPQLVGQLTVADIKGLRDAIIAAETMEKRHANRVCKALAAVL